MKYSTVIVAAGSGTRMHLGYNKVYAPLADGRTVLEHTMDVFLQDEDCVQIIVVTDAYEYKEKITGRWPGKILIAKGGASRQESVANGLMAVLADYVLIHDGARPFLEKETLETIKKTLETEDAVLPAVACKDTIKRVEDGCIAETYRRETLCAAQTPQAFRTSVIISCMEKAFAEGYTGTDDCSLVERYSDTKIRVVEGSYANIKITTPEDLKS